MAVKSCGHCGVLLRTGCSDLLASLPNSVKKHPTVSAVILLQNFSLRENRGHCGVVQYSLSYHPDSVFIGNAVCRRASEMFFAVSIYPTMSAVLFGAITSMRSLYQVVVLLVTLRIIANIDLFVGGDWRFIF
jgi:hypothetical protein